VPDEALLVPQGPDLGAPADAPEPAGTHA
jgi:hypothetical protein